MKLSILYHPNSEFARSIEEFVHDFNASKNFEIELLSLETKEGAATASLYDISVYPAILAIRNDGQIMKSWEGSLLPRIDEVAGYLD